MKQPSLSINQIYLNILKWKNLNINNIVIVFFFVCTLVPYVSWLSYLWSMVTILISIAFIVAALIRGWRLFEARRLLDEIRYLIKRFSLKNPDFMFLDNFIFVVSLLKIQRAVHLNTYYSLTCRVTSPYILYDAYSEPCVLS